MEGEVGQGILITAVTEWRTYDLAVSPWRGREDGAGGAGAAKGGCACKESTSKVPGEMTS